LRSKKWSSSAAAEFVDEAVAVSGGRTAWRPAQDLEKALASFGGPIERRPVLEKLKPKN
jgi:hypothetical protein